MLPSTAGHATWAVLADACPSSSSTCPDLRGGVINVNESTSWHEFGIYSLALEQNLGYEENGDYGLDSIALGLSGDTGHPILDSQVVVGIETEKYYTGLFGLTNQPTGLSNFTVSNPSFLTDLKTQNLIPSLSWAYTAGARYRSKGVFGSLTFGGYDKARYTPNNISFNLAPDVGRDLVVGLQSIKSTYANGSSQSFLPSPILSFIDSTIPYIYLPIEACQVFEAEFGLVWNSTTNLYLLDDSTHRGLLASNPQFIFTIGNDKTNPTTVDINLPYASFDLEISPPALPNATYYFPLRRAANETQYTLGRSFLQEA